MQLKCGNSAIVSVWVWRILGVVGVWDEWICWFAEKWLAAMRGLRLAFVFVLQRARAFANWCELRDAFKWKHFVCVP